MITEGLYKEIGKLFWYTGTIIACTMWLEDKFMAQAARDAMQDQKILVIEKDLDYIKTGKLNIGEAGQAREKSNSKQTFFFIHPFIGDRKKEISLKFNKKWTGVES